MASCTCWIGRGDTGGWAPDRLTCAVHGGPTGGPIEVPGPAVYGELFLDTTPLTKHEALEALNALTNNEPESGHVAADNVLLRLINDQEIRAAFLALTRWYA